MAWPPVPPPNTRSNTTPRPTNLANDINLTSEAITELTARANDSPPACITGRQAVSTDAQGEAIIQYGATFTETPVCMVMVDISSTGDVTWFVTVHDAVEFKVKVRNNGTLYTGGLSVEWAAFGTLA